MPPRPKWDPEHFWSPLFDRERRLATHRSILGPDPRCDRCGETRRPALSRRGTAIVCYECQAIEEGRNPVELDHPLGRGDRWVHYTKPTPGNRHRVLSDPDFGPGARMLDALEPDDRVRRLLRRV